MVLWALYINSAENLKSWFSVTMLFKSKYSVSINIVSRYHTELYFGPLFSTDRLQGHLCCLMDTNFGKLWFIICCLGFQPVFIVHV